MKIIHPKPFFISNKSVLIACCKFFPWFPPLAKDFANDTFCANLQLGKHSLGPPTVALDVLMLNIRTPICSLQTVFTVPYLRHGIADNIS